MDRGQAAVDHWVPMIYIVMAIIVATIGMSHLGLTDTQIEAAWYSVAAVAVVAAVVAMYRDLKNIGENRS